MHIFMHFAYYYSTLRRMEGSLRLAVVAMVSLDITLTTMSTTQGR